ncbi:MAG: 1-deoxy-D-xylulose-5-phosphate synthase [Desulfomonile tiedjei]|uniref:1-deoxy-D-xylulose-5-phosphate synthase n=1 Tax=Desulfomonile tiedjei TaxID=2358 RepID=A0A9D6V5L9_9BACT|nr:1-deoxy-D-xylulose-5-phosphate synthase [Desulfomonile tiedjei]
MIENKPISSDPILDGIDSPADIQDLSVDDLKILASEVRDLIIKTVAKRGGHLASSLGVVELTLAVLKVFSPPKDRIVFDVGHQAYAYKILTGRRDAFETLRTKGGLSGFPKRDESEYDFFDVGHAGNAISVAAGLAQARCFSGSDHKVIAVVGDGSLTCGVSYEGLNQAGAAEKDLIIILNDNEMSISPNVGAMAAYLNRIMTGQIVTRFRAEVKNILKNVMGESIYSLAKQFEDALKGFITPGKLFEDLGFKYVGPIDGHQLKHLIDTLRNVKRFREPVLIHTITCKGKGYCQAEENPSRFHGVGPFDISTGRVEEQQGPPSYTTVFGKTLVKLAAKDPKIVAITAAMEYGTGLAEFARLFPKRFFDVGIAEQHGVVFAAGLAKEGYRPVVAIYSTFLQRGYDHLIHDVCMQKFPVVFAMDRAGLVGEDGPTHHGIFDIAFARNIPNITIMAPADEDQLADMLATALTIDGPVAMRYPRSCGLGVTLKKEPEILQVGKGQMLVEGRDFLIIAIGSMVAPAMEASRLLALDGIAAGVLDARFVKPLDKELLLQESSSTGGVLVVEEGILAGGFGSAVLELFSEEGLENVRTSRMGIPDTFAEHGTREELLRDFGLTPDNIAERVRSMLSDRSGARLKRFSSIRH